MLMSASSDFIALCREQISLLTQGLGASLSVVYLTQEIGETSTGEAQLIPVVVYPETTVLQQGEELIQTQASSQIELEFDPILPPPTQQGKLLTATSASEHPPESDNPNQATIPESDYEYVVSGNQIVLPLIYEGVMMGLLVTGREDRPWNENEESQIRHIAKTLAIACILDQRQVWLQQQLHQQQILQEQQRDLLDNLLHQFRNPLTAIRTFGKLLLKRLRPADPNQEVASSIVRESDRLKELLQQFDHVIALTNADLQPIPLKASVEPSMQSPAQIPLLLPGTGEEITTCQISDLLAPLLISAQAIAQERNLQLITDIPPNLPLVKANIKAVQEVLNNIIDNALKYTPKQGKVWIQATYKKDNFQGIAISDTGPGIPPQDLEHLGERHYRGVQAQTEIPGTGLGIAIAKQLIAQMQGDIEVFSPALNQNINSPKQPGTTFIIWLVIEN
ncbi:MAG: GAF domain-containing protein [Nostocales cyanobacterium]|nr:MAG: GAF domain-containing protein [Nostocales cyanobacterium]TAF19834.1 MAG: GAF domain-containing protein [Nostocales cyanobacterium]